MASTKLFNFRCPSELLQAVEDFAAAKGLTKSESAATLLRLGLQSQSVEVPATTPKPRKTEGETGVRHESETGVRHESETGVRHEGERLTELESKFESRLAALESRFESRLAAIEEGQRLGGAGSLRGEVDSLRLQLAEARAEIAELSRRNSELDSEAAELAGKVGDLDLENQELRQQLAATVAERDDMERAAEMTGTPATTESAPPPPDLPAIRSRVLAGLKLGRQAPGYKAAAKALAAFEEALEERFPKTYRAPETQEEGP